MKHVGNPDFLIPYSSEEISSIPDRGMAGKRIHCLYLPDAGRIQNRGTKSMKRIVCLAAAVALLFSFASVSAAEGLFDAIVEDAKTEEAAALPSFSSFSGTAPEQIESEGDSTSLEYTDVDLDLFQAFGAYLLEKGYAVAASERMESRHILAIQSTRDASLYFQVQYDTRDRILRTVYPADARIEDFDPRDALPADTEVPQPVYEEIYIPPIGQNALKIDPVPPNAFTAESAEILSCRGEIPQPGEEKSYSFQTAVPGRCRIELSEMQDGVQEELYLYDGQGTRIAYNVYCSNGKGITADGLNAGETYTVQIAAKGRTAVPEGASCLLTVGLQKQTMDISALTQVADSMEYTEQKNLYRLTAPADGTYRLDFSEMMSGTVISIKITNRLGETVAARDHCENQSGVTASNLVRGETYDIAVTQRKGFSGYTMRIGRQKETVDISPFTKVEDSIEFKDQKNRYLFTAPRDGRYHFELSGMLSGTGAGLYVLNRLGETVGSKGYCENGSGVTLKGLKAGETYQVQVIQNQNCSGYTLSIGIQKEPVAVSRGMIVHDSVEYRDQRNVYFYTAPSEGDVRFSLSGIQSGTSVELMVFNELGETLASDGNAQNDDSLTIENVAEGTVLQVQVRQDNGTGEYTLTID
jgi:hypothetical protein